LSVTWTGAAGTPAGGSHTTTPAPISNIGREIPIPTSVVAFNLGKAVTVTYTVTRNGTAYPPSQPLNLAVQAIPNEDGALPTLVIDGAVGNELNISTLLDGARTRIAKWPFIALGQKLWLRYSGTNADGSAFTDQTYNAAPIPTDGLPNGMLPHAPVAKLRNLKDGSTLRVEFKVTFDGSTDESTAVTFPVRTYTIKAVAIVAPTLDSVKGSPSGEEIPDNGYTVETAVTLSGTASKGYEVEVFDGVDSKGKAMANATTGIWTLLVSGLSETAHRFTAKALYGSGEVSAARAINVTALIKPTLDKVADASGQDIPEADTTISTTLTLSGTASRGQRVEIFDGYGGGAASHGIATANATTGEWQHPISVIQGGRRLYAKSLYHSTTEYSNVRTLTVVPDVAPTLTSVKGSPSGEDIPDGDTTVETAVTLSGTASKGQKVEIFDGVTSKGQATADKSTGVWSLLVSGLSETVHRFKAKALYGNGMESAVRTFTVRAAGFEDWEQESLRELPFDTPITFASGLTLTVIRWGRPLSSPQFLIPDSVAMGNVTLQTGSYVKHIYKLPIESKSVSFEYAHHVDHNSKVDFYDKAGNLLGSEGLQRVINSEIRTVNRGSLVSCSYFEVIIYNVETYREGMYIDRIRWGS
jgi:hypothetical protein